MHSINKEKKVTTYIQNTENKTRYSEIYEIANQVSTQEFIAENLCDPWVGTPFQGYKFLDNKQKGNFGELFVSNFFRDRGSKVEKSSKSNDSYDRKIDGYRVEIKFSIAHTDNKKKIVKPDCFTMNHVSVNKEWDRLLFVGINPLYTYSHIKFMNKKTFIDLLGCEEEFKNFFSSQQGGNNGGNDDYMSADKKLYRLLTSQYMKDISAW